MSVSGDLQVVTVADRVTNPTSRLQLSSRQQSRGSSRGSVRLSPASVDVSAT